MDLIEEFHAEDHLEVVNGNDGEVKPSASCSKHYVHAVCDTHNWIGGRVHRLHRASFLGGLETLVLGLIYGHEVVHRSRI